MNCLVEDRYIEIQIERLFGRQIESQKIDRQLEDIQIVRRQIEGLLGRQIDNTLKDIQEDIQEDIKEDIQEDMKVNMYVCRQIRRQIDRELWINCLVLMTSAGVDMSISVNQILHSVRVTYRVDIQIHSYRVDIQIHSNWVDNGY